MHNCHATEAKAGEKRLTELMSYRVNMQRTSANTRSMNGVDTRIAMNSRLRRKYSVASNADDYEGTRMQKLQKIV